MSQSSSYQVLDRDIEVTDPMGSDKATEILNVARRLMMERGYNGFSFRDVAAEVGIKSASIHYHFPSKAELAETAARDYREWCSRELANLSAPDALGCPSSEFLGQMAA